MDITLSLPYDLTTEQWKIVDEVYRSMDGWIGYDTDNIPQWYGPDQSPRYICASVEPSALLVCGEVPEMLWIGWITKFCARPSLRLGFEVCDAAM